MKLLCLLGWFSILLPNGMPFLFPKKKVDLTPASVNICTTQNQTMVCKVVDENYNVSDIVFELNDDRVDASDVETVDNQTAKIQLRNLRQDDNNLNVLCCVDNCSTVDGYDSVSVQVYVMPVPIQELSCIIYDYTMNVTCTWEYGANYTLRGGWPIVTFHVGLLNTPSVASWSIPDLQTRREFTESNDYRLFNQPEISISLVVKSKCGNETKTQFPGNQAIRVEPSAVSKFASLSLNSTCIYLSWEHNRKTLIKSYRISAQSVWGTNEIKIDESEYHKNIHEYTLCKLIPGTKYSFEIKVKPLGIPGIWSVPMVTSNKTTKAVPGSSPSTTHGGYSWKHQACQSGLFLRLVYIYWQPIPAEHFNGIMRGTRINFTSDEGTDSMFLGDLSANFTVKQLPCYKAYNVTLQAENDIGLSIEPSSIFITAADIDVVNDLRVERSMSNNNTVDMEWTGNVHSESVSTVFYIEENGPVPDCGGIFKGQASWVKSSPGATSHVITLPVGKEPEDFCYARAVETRGESTGFEWSSCIYMGDIAPSRSPSDLKVTVGNEDNTLVLTWRKWVCPKGEPYISQYDISYGPRGLNPNATDGFVILSYLREETSAVLKDLDSDQQYDIRIRAVTRFGVVGPWSEAVSGQSVDNSLKPGAIAGITVGCVFGGLIIIAAIVCFFRMCRRQTKRKLESMRSIDTPKIYPDTLHDKHGKETADPVYRSIEDQNTDVSDEKKTTELNLKLTKPTPQRQNSDDSGVPEDPLTPPINDVPRMEKIPEGYSRAVSEFQNNGYIGTEVLIVAHVANGMIPTQSHVKADSYVKAEHMIHTNPHHRDGSPILGDDRKEDGNNKFGNDNTAFTDDQGNHGNNITKALQINSPGIATRPISEPFDDIKAEIKTWSLAVVDTMMDYKPDSGGSLKQILKTNSSVPRLNALESNKEIEKQIDPKLNMEAIEDTMDEGGISSYVDFAGAPDQRSENADVGLPDTPYISQTSLLLQQNNSSAYAPNLPVPNQSTSTDVPRMTGYVFHPPIENLRKGQILASDYVTHSDIHNQSEAQTGQSDYLPHDQIDTKVNRPANIPEPVIGNQTSVIPASEDHYVPESFLQNQSAIQPTLTGLSPQSSQDDQSAIHPTFTGLSPQFSQDNQSQIDKQVSDYVPHSFMSNITAKPRNNTEYVHHTNIAEPSLHKATTSDVSSSKPSNVNIPLQDNNESLHPGYIDSSSLEKFAEGFKDSRIPEVSSELLSSVYVIIDGNNQIRPANYETSEVHEKGVEMEEESDRNDSGNSSLENSLSH